MKSIILLIIQVFFTNTKLTTKKMANEDNKTIHKIPDKTGSYSMTQIKGLN